MIYEDTYRVRQLNEIKVQHELQTIDLLQKCLNESNENTNKMNNLLNNFENRLTALHDLIVPVYDATNTLQIKHSNINKTVNQLENIIEYYNSVKNLSLVIQAGPGKDINNYISQLNKLRSAIEYFAANKNQSQKKQNEDLWNQGKLNVDREFDQLLNKFSDATLAFVEKDNDLENNNQMVDANSLNLKENDLSQIVSIIDWFRKVEPTYLDKLYEKLIRVRHQLILDNLKKIKDKGNSLSNKNNMLNSSSIMNSSNMNNSASGQNANVTMRRQSSLIPSASSSNFNNMLNTSNEDRKSTIRSRLTENLLNSASDLRRKKSTVTNVNDLSVLGANQSRIPNTFMVEQDFETTECVKFIHCVRKALKMFHIENIFLSKIIDTKERVIISKILERIFDPVLRFLKTEAERLASNMKQITSKFTSKYVIAMFSVLSDFVGMKAEFLRVFDYSTLITKTSRHISNSVEHFLEIFAIIERACSQTLKDIIEEIKNDPQTIQPNGNIHPITTETITFVKNLLPFDLIAGFIAKVVVNETQNQMLPSEIEINLRRESSRANEAKFTQIAYQVNSESEKQQYRDALADYFYKLFCWLNLNLKNKAENYDDQTLKWIFLLNNTYKISKLFTDSNNSNSNNLKAFNGKFETLNQLFLLAGKTDMKSFYDSEILNYKREYSKCWSKLLSFIKDLNESNPFTDTKLKDKERQLLKDKFSGFNKEFEEIYETQKRYYIPSEQAELAEILRQDNSIYIISQYKRFYDTYSRINFATNREKYIKYSPEDLTVRIREFFSAY